MRDANEFHIGTMVTHAEIPGIGRVGGIDAGNVRVDCFESVVEPVAESWCVNADECRRIKLQEQTRVYWQDPDTGIWQTGRIVGGDQAEYFVRLPNSEVDFKVPEPQLRVRWDMPVRNPVDVLVAGANESGYFSNARLPMMRSLVAQRAACGSAFALLSSGVEIFPHQVHAAMTVISDPVQRYLLADEVGLGKTIEAGLVIRQVLLDEPMSKIVVIAPNALRRQWQDELRSKFFVGDFPFATIRISSHETPEKWQSYQGCDLIVVDEAHSLVQVDDPAQSPYRELAALAHSVQRVLLLSATPLTSRVTTHLGLLHLLEPHLYKWTEREAFEQRFRLRKQLANAVYGLDSDYEQLLPSSIAEIEGLIPADPQFRRLSEQALSFLTEDDNLRAEGDRPGLAVAVEALRAHISETYRLHRRMIRHRRVQVTKGEDAATRPYELTGRTRPGQVVLNLPRQQLVEEALLNWQSGIANWLADVGREKEAKAYGQVLGVLVSRADGASADLADALRWRLNRDEPAAERAGLTSEERALLSGPPVASLERGVLAQISDAPDDSDLAELADALRLALRGQQRVVVFCGAGSLATRLASALRREDPRLRVGEHTHQTGMAEGDTRVAAWRKGGGVLVADDSAEEGLNLQGADAVVHCRLPWSPNRLEQRIGRVDRYRAGTLGQPARQFVVTGSDGEYTLPGSWLTLLDEAFGIFGQSVSALQDSIDQGLADIWAAAALGGPEGLSRLIPMVTHDLTKERREIDGMDMLEAIHDARTGVVDIAAAIGELEVGWRDIEAATMGFASDAAVGGLRFLAHVVGPDGQITQFERGRKPPLVPPRILALGGTHLTPEMMRGSFNRAVTLKEPGTRVLRSGNPFIDMLARTVWIDDRGQATVLERRYPGEANVYFGFDFLVEADIESALGLVGDDPISRNALRRHADCLLAPFTRRIWVPLPGKVAIDEPTQVKWLDQPYKPKQSHGPDINLNAQRISALFVKFGGRDRFTGGARYAEHVARDELSRVTDLRARCEEARQQAASSLAVHRAQAEARKAAGRIVTDTEGYSTDLGIADALIDGLANPAIKVISVTCLVRGALPEVDRG